MNKTIAVAVVLTLAGSTATVGYLQFKQSMANDELLAKQGELMANLAKAQEQLSVTSDTLTGFTKFTAYVVEGQRAMTGQSKFLAAKVDREFTIIEHIKKVVMGVHSDAAVSVKYKVEFSVGFDLRPENFSISGEKNRITVTVKAPELVASPAVHILSHEILNKGIITDEKGAIIAIQQHLLPMALKHGAEIIKEPAVIALCEKKLAEFLQDFMSKQPGVAFVPAVKFAYK